MSITDDLKHPFDTKVIHWRVGATNAKKLGVKPWEATKGIALAYLDARDVMKRLDDVCGDLWQDRYPYEGCCEISIKIDGEWLTRANGAGVTDVEGEKGQYSDAFKRAAVLWGVGRYLYYLPNKWVDIKDGKIINPPQLPDWAKPSVFRFKKGGKEKLMTKVLEGLSCGDDVAVRSALHDYDSPESKIAAWACFTSGERSAIKAMLSDDK